MLLFFFRGHGTVGVVAIIPAQEYILLFGIDYGYKFLHGSDRSLKELIGPDKGLKTL